MKIRFLCCITERVNTAGKYRLVPAKDQSRLGGISHAKLRRAGMVKCADVTVSKRNMKNPTTLNVTTTAEKIITDMSTTGADGNGQIFKTPSSEHKFHSVPRRPLDTRYYFSRLTGRRWQYFMFI